MVFLDTCIWIELCTTRNPVKAHEVRQAREAGNLLARLIQDNMKIISMREQLVELIAAIQKVKMREYNKAHPGSGVGSLKEFRCMQEFQVAKQLCKQACEDVQELCLIDEANHYDIDEILNKMDQADLNDIVYYSYCEKVGAELYTFDKDYMAIDSKKIVHII